MWARTVDELLLFWLLWVFVHRPAREIVGQLAKDVPPFFVALLLFMIVAIPLFVLVEASMLSWWGTTPGKALLNVRVRRNDGAKLTYTEAFKRTLNVWVSGEGFGIPVLTLFTRGFACNKLTREGITSWDSGGGIRVAHKRLGAVRVIFAGILVGLMMGLGYGTIDKCIDWAIAGGICGLLIALIGAIGGEPSVKRFVNKLRGRDASGEWK